jgi:subtilisin family serine protease
MVDESGARTEFVADELIVATNDPAVLQDFVARWNGSVLATTDFRANGYDVPTQYLVRIDPSRADLSRMIADLKTLSPEQSGALVLSSEQGQATLAASAREVVAGRPVSLNVLLSGDAFWDRELEDGSGFGNAFEQSHLRGDCTPFSAGTCTAAGVTTASIGVTEAWRVLESACKLGNKVQVTVIDEGFSNQSTGLGSFVHYVSSGPINAQALVGCGNPPQPANCPWHGTNVAQAVAAVVDDGIGVAGVAAPVAKLQTITRGPDIFSTAAALNIAFNVETEEKQIINMSFGGAYPATVSATVQAQIDGMNRLTREIRLNGGLLFAAAGNSSLDVGTATRYLPCELDGVICVGGIDGNGNRASGANGSNFGAPVDLWAPYTVVVGPDPAAGIRSASGTSFASPYAAGVAALVWAASPALFPDEVEQILRDSSQASGDTNVGRYLDARAAVVRALGTTPPEPTAPIQIVSPRYGDTLGNALPITFQAAGRNPAVCGSQPRDQDVRWYSSLETSGANPDGYLGSGRRLDVRLRKTGVHAITVVHRWGSGASAWAYDAIEILVQDVNTPPRVVISRPTTRNVTVSVVNTDSGPRGCLFVQGVGIDAQDGEIYGQNPFNLYWESNRGDLYEDGWSSPIWFVQSGTICLRPDPRTPQGTEHLLTLHAIDSAGLEGVSETINVYLVPGLR